MLAYESVVLSFKGRDIFNEEFMIKMISKFFNPGDVVLKTQTKTMQIKLKVEDFLNPHHAIRKALAAYPDVDLLVSREKINEEYFDINDPFVSSYLLFANDWEDNLKVPLPPVDTLFLQENNLLLNKSIK